MTPPRLPAPGRPTSGTVAAVLARDVTCTFPGCAVPAFRCDLDHVVAPRPGDEDAHDAANLVSLCRPHRVARARDGWRPALLRDGTVRWTAPSGHVYLRAATRSA
ncbi:HNH endonuclease signature motif containing protein [Cellulosimicrobium marinum]|uniref:HNH endonuclease signature motif containing protein n=1 Tax=Cellulosimicrobium marinum TaxID=1638992 RepID=UPI001E53747B|nr:HNH endonuclease signature motif containing protein [Cellulosimicrobium marinum]MCB7135136.1 HNH endonuclease [Cellulosimicrobium marinum]